jgi:homoserine O-acetyltransferase
MTAAVTLPANAGLCHLPARLPLARGGVLDGAVLAFERQGPLDAPVVVVLGGISAGRHVSSHSTAEDTGWWEGFVGDGLAVDTRRFQVLSFDWLGGVGASTQPRPGEPFPFVGTEDQAQALLHLLSVLGIGWVHALVGSSYGGMVGLQFGALAPARLDRLAVIAAPAHSHPQASAWRAVQRDLVELGARAGFGAESVALARALAMTTYRTPEELGERFAGAPSFEGQTPRLPVQPWLTARGRAFAERWSAEQFLCLCASIDAHVVDPAAIPVPTALLSFTSDQLVPPQQIRDLANALPRVLVHREVPSRFGHDAFLKERAAVTAFVQEVLR